MSEISVVAKENVSLRNKSIHSLLTYYAEQTPDAVAIAAPGRQPLTYGSLRDHVAQVAETLNQFSIARNDRVAIVLPNGPEMVTAFLATTMAATSAPLNPGYHADEFEFYLSDLNAKALLTWSGMGSPAIDSARSQGIPVIEISPISDPEAGIFNILGEIPSRPVEQNIAEPDEVALVLHTSGTTSRPKIVPLTHTNIITSAQNIQTALGLVSGDLCLNVMPLFHIHGLVGATLSSLIAGAGIVCTSGFSVSSFYQCLDDFQPTWYTAVPTMHQAILDARTDYHKTIARSSLRFIRSCSSPLPPSVMASLENIFNVPVIESYGMTEAAHQMTSNPMPPKKRKAGSVGIAAGPEVAIMDEKGNLVPPSEIGEIVIRGANVTSGYENNPKANEEAYTNGWFRTGDQGLLDTDGYLYISGRIKEIINRGGEKIIPREIDEVLLEHPAIVQAVAFAVPHSSLGEDVAVAVVLGENSTSTERELREFAFKRLSDYKVPSRVIFVSEIPKGPTGKLQRIGLAQKLEPNMTAEFVAPQKPAEELLARIWSEILGLEKVGIRDNFFACGGDSLKAAQVVSRIGKSFQVTVPLKTIFIGPTVADQALLIEELLLKEIESLTEKEAQQLIK